MVMCLLMFFIQFQWHLVTCKPHQNVESNEMNIITYTDFLDLSEMTF